MRRTRVAAIGGIVGPAVFVTAWAVLGARTKHYSPVRNHISRLAAIGAPTRPEMTAAFLTFSAGLALYAVAAREHLSPRVAALATVNAVSTVGVAALPLEGFGGGLGHAAAATIGYVSLAAMPCFGGRRAERAVTVAVAAPLLLSALGGARAGLWQRTGLTIGDAWLVVSSVRMLREAA